MYRKISQEFWVDAKVERLSPMGKLLMLYILTAPQGNLVGCFEITPKRMGADTGLSEEEVANALTELCETGAVRYSAEHNEVLIRNWCKYNWSVSPKVAKAVGNSIDSVKDERHRSYLAQTFSKVFGSISDKYAYPIDTLSVGYETPVQISDRYDTDTISDTYGYDSVSVTDTDTDTSNKSQVATGNRKHKYGECSNVLLTDSELEKLQKRFPDDWQTRIDNLSFYIGSKGDKYKSHYLTILNWDRRDSRKAPAGKSSKEAADELYPEYAD